MNQAILHPEVQDFILKNRKEDLAKLILKGSPFTNVTIQEIARQISALNKAKKKLPTWFTQKDIIYPEALNLEQTSSEITAKYKASLISGENLIDLTGGFGIDDYYFAESFKKVTHCEMNTELSEQVSHNFKVLRRDNVKTVKGDSLEYLRSIKEHLSWIYLDPARRNDDGGKVFRLNQCTPNVSDHLNLLFEKAENILIKTSPLLDLKAGILELEFVKEIHIIAVQNEVKELLWILKKGHNGDIQIKTINLIKDQEQKLDGWFYKDQGNYSLSLPLKYLYEPNPAIMKSGLFGALSLETNTLKLHANSHLYTSKDIVYFPGRSFKIVDITKYSKKHLKKSFKLDKANVTARNFPKSVEILRKELRIKDGGESYLFFTTDMNNDKIVINCRKI